MSFASRLVEEKIRQAQQEGAFENLPGSGKPLRLEAEPEAPAELRLAYKILKNAHCLPPEMELRREILSLQSLLDCLEDAEEYAKRIRQINFLTLKLNGMRKAPPALEVRQMIAEKLAARNQPTGKSALGCRQAAKTMNTLPATDDKGNYIPKCRFSSWDTWVSAEGIYRGGAVGHPSIRQRSPLHECLPPTLSC